MIGLLSVIEPATFDEALLDDGWILAMEEELNQFQRNDVWDLDFVLLNSRASGNVAVTFWKHLSH